LQVLLVLVVVARVAYECERAVGAGLAHEVLVVQKGVAVGAHVSVMGGSCICSCSRSRHFVLFRWQSHCIRFAGFN
jgi:hypothetical protein